MTWIEDNIQATRSAQAASTAAVAEQFDRIVRAIVQDRRERESAGAGDPERRHGLEGEEAGAEAGAVPGRPDRQRQLEAPAVGHLAARLRKRETHQPCLSRRRDERVRDGFRRRGRRAQRLGE